MENTKICSKFICLAEKFPKDSLRARDNEGHEVSAQSILGMLYSLEWKDIFFYSKDENVGIYDTFAFYGRINLPNMPRTPTVGSSPENCGS